MKKKIYLLSMFTLGTMAFAQCNIIGKTNIHINELVEFTTDSEAQCENCYQWKTTGNNIVMMGEGKQKKLQVKGSGQGQATLSLTVLTSNGTTLCNKTIEVNSPENVAPIDNSTSNCDIDIKDFKEAKVSDSIIGFFPNITENSYNYSWSIEYFNGNSQTSEEKVPQFQYNKDNMRFKTVKVKVISKKCLRELTKNYDESFWNFFY